jgi:hypothetical protein
MRILKTMPIMLLAATMMTACGKKNDSGSGSSSGGVTTGSFGTDGLPTTTGTSFSTIEQLRSHISNSSMSVTAGTVIERFGGLAESVSSSDSNSVTLRELIYNAGTNSANNQYGNSRTLSKTSPIYTEMLMNTAGECDRVDMTPASILITDLNGSNQRTIQAVRATCIKVSSGSILWGSVNTTSTTSKQSIIYTSAFPLAANPVVILNSDIQLNYLRRVGNALIKNVQ